MKCSLYQADSGGALFVGSIHHSLHEAAADASALSIWIDGDGPDSCNGGTLIKAVASYDSAFAFGYHAIETGGGKHRGKDADGSVWAGKITRETVRPVEREERVVANLPAWETVLRDGWTEFQVRLWFWLHRAGFLPVSEVIPASVLSTSYDEIVAMFEMAGFVVVRLWWFDLRDVTISVYGFRLREVL